MKSPQVENADYIADKERYSHLKVMKSGAGFYIGTTYYNVLNGAVEPGSRDSVEYYGSVEEAEDDLRNESWTQRIHP